MLLAEDILTEARVGAVVAARRELLMDVVHELRALAAQVEVRIVGVGNVDMSQVAAQKHRLRVALDFSSNELPLRERPLTSTISRSR